MKRRALIYALLLLFITTAPYLLAWSRQDEDWRFSGFLFGVEDGNSYLGKMRLGGRGVWDFYLFYTPEPHEPVSLVFLPYILPGQIVGQIVPETSPAHTQALIITFHLMRIVCDVLLLVVLDRFIRAFVRSESARLTALILATIGGGLGWLVSFTGTLPAEFYIPEGFGFLVLFGLPHLALARAALLGGMLLIIKSTEYGVLSTEIENTELQRSILEEKKGVQLNAPTRNLPAIETGREGERASSVLSTQHSVLYALLAGVCWLVVALAVPFYLVVIYAVLGAWGLVTWVRQRVFPWRLFVRCIIAAGLTLPFFLYASIAFSTNPAFAVWSAQNQLSSPPPLQYLFAYSLVGIPALAGMVWAWREGKINIRYGLLVGWVLIVPLLVYLPINVQRRLSEAVIVPLAILAAVGIERWVGKRSARKWLSRVWITAACLSTGLLLIGSILAANNPARPLFRPTSEIAALDWLNAYTSADEVVLSSVQIGNVLPAYTHLRPFMGHGPETLEWQHKTVLVERFFSDSMSAAERATLYESTCLEAQPTLCADPIRYLIYSPLERALNPSEAVPQWQAEWTLIYDVEGVQIYER